MLDGGLYALRFFLVRDLDILALELDEFGFECWRLAADEQRMNRPIFLRDERSDFLLALGDQAQRYGLHASGG